MNTVQQSQKPQWYAQEKDETATQAGTLLEEQTHDIFSKMGQLIPILKDDFLHHHQICAKVSIGTFNADKLIRLVSAIVKLIRTHGLAKNLKVLEKLGAQIGQLRRLLRFDRLFMIFKDYVGYSKKDKLSNVDKMMILFKAMILCGDFSDITAFFIQLNIIPKDYLMPQLRKRVADLYFIECVGWLLFHIYEYIKSDSKQLKQRNKMLIIRYLMDAIVSHNDFSRRRFTMNTKAASAIGLVSSILNLYMVWK